MVVVRETSADPPTPPSDRRLDDIFGRDLGTEHREIEHPETRAETGAEERAREDWYRENRPPHHDEA